MGVDITNQFHTYRVDWDPKKMVFYFDGQPYWSISIDKIMQSPFYKGKTFLPKMNYILDGWKSKDLMRAIFQPSKLKLRFGLIYMYLYSRKGTTFWSVILSYPECCCWRLVSWWTRSLGWILLSWSWNVGWLGQVLGFEWYWWCSRLWLYLCR